MSYPSEVLHKAREEFNRNKEDFRAKNDALRMKIYNAVPMVQVIEREIATTSVRLSKALIMGSNVEKNVAEIKKFNESKKKELGDLLVANGFLRDSLDEKFLCPICRDTGIYNGKPCVCIEKLRRKYMYERLGNITEKEYPTFEELNLSLYGSFSSLMASTIEKCQKYADNFTMDSKSLLLVGQPGLGKTHVSKAMGKIIIDKGYDVFYVSYSTLIQNLENERFNGGGEDENKSFASYLKPVLNCELLILDDVLERTTSFSSAILYEIVNSRLNNHLPTIINTNLSDSEISREYGERTASRLLYCYSIMMFKSNDDIRKKIKYHLY